MKLDVFLRKNKISDAAFALMVGVDRSVVTRWRNGNTVPSDRNKQAISKVTRNKVMPNDFMVPRALEASCDQ